MANIDGTSGNDIILGTPLGDRIRGFGGDDRINGLNGNDRILGGSGNDDIIGFAGDDRINGGSGNDSLDGREGDDRIVGGGGADRLDGGIGVDTLIGGGGRDIFVLSATESSDQDLIIGFKKGVDKFELPASGGLEFDDLNILDFGATGIVIQIADTNEQIAAVGLEPGVFASDIDASDFV